MAQARSAKVIVLTSSLPGKIAREEKKEKNVTTQLQLVFSPAVQPKERKGLVQFHLVP